jgi:hypothetical protein
MATNNLNFQLHNVPGSYLQPQILLQDSVVQKSDGRTVTVPRDQLIMVPEMTQVAYLPSLTTPGSFNGNYFDFKLVKGQYGIIKDISLDWVLSETGNVNSITVEPAPYLVQRIELRGNSGNVLIQTLMAEQMMFHFGTLLTQEQQQRLAANANISLTNYKSAGSIAAGSTVHYFWPLLGNFITQNGGLYFPGLNDDFYIRIYTRSGVTVTGSGTLGITGVNLIIEYDETPDMVKNDLAAQFRGAVLERNFLETVNYTTNQTFTAGTATSLQLSPLIGICPYLFYGFRSSYAAASIATWTSQGIAAKGAAVEIDEASGRNITGQSPWYPDYLITYPSAEYTPGPLSATIPMYPLFFGDILAAENKVIRKGAINFSGTEYIKVTPDSSFATGAYYFDVFARIFRRVHINNGTFEPIANY